MIVERDPKKRRVKPAGPAQQSLLDFDLGESSDDSDFRIEDHYEETDDSLDSDDDGGKGGGDDDDDDFDDDEGDSEDSEDPLLGNLKGNMTIGDVIEQAKRRQSELAFSEAAKVLICCGCLGDRSDDANEIVECDGCGVTVHEGCYGVSDAASVSSTVSSCSTEPWFCEACRAGVTDPTCELCPNKGGIFKETDVGRWVHLVCALYVPGVAFGEVDKLSSVTLFEMPYSKWGAKTCGMCEDEKFAHTGVCIGCDAGMCRTVFHVTCAQREGLLSEPHSEEVDQADPFYAHCKLHTDKALMRRRRRNWLALQLRTQQRQQKQEGQSDSAEQLRIRRKLSKYREKYKQLKCTRVPPWVPTQKMPRLLTTSASACRRLLRKAELMGIDTQALEAQEAQVASLVDVRKKWHIPPAFSVEFIGYYLDRNIRLSSMKRRLQELLDINSQLQDEQELLRGKYDELLKEKEKSVRAGAELKQTVTQYHSVILAACPSQALPSVEELCQLDRPLASPLPLVVSPAPRHSRMQQQQPRAIGLTSRKSVSDAPITADSGPMALRDCGICHQSNDQHLLAHCDTCGLYYHLGCLNPPLSRIPKKTKQMGWQCSECDKESSGSEPEFVDTNAPRQLRRKEMEDKKVPAVVKEAEEKKPVVSIQQPQHQHVLKQQMVTPKVTIKPIGPQPTLKVSEPPAPEIPQPRLVVSPMTINRAQHPDEAHVAQRGSSSSGGGGGKKRRREKHHRYSPNGSPVGDGGAGAAGGATGGSSGHKHKRKRKSQDLENPSGGGGGMETPRIKIKIKPIPNPSGEATSMADAQMFVATSSTETTPVAAPLVVAPLATVSPLARKSSARAARSSSSSGGGGGGGAAAKKAVDVMTKCDTCNQPGTNDNLVRCDDCMKCFHFTCLDPPVRKSPKRRGYSWHCAECDPTETESDN